ncbi:hypothetical protein, partial [Candidatus Aquicultor secundus]|uniref:hypothetical protein n=1 Tax=Candidatus Aquicultor secundus TaxID=1973895 RepID=UPI000CA864FA
MDDNVDIQDKPSKLRFATSLGAIGLGIVGFIHGDAWIIAAVVILGPVWSVVALSVVIAIIANAILILLSLSNPFGFIQTLKLRLEKSQNNLSPLTLKAIKVSKLLGILVSSMVIGAFPTALLIHTLGYRRPYNHLLATASSLLFSLTWVTIYS